MFAKHIASNFLTKPAKPLNANIMMNTMSFLNAPIGNGLQVSEYSHTLKRAWLSCQEKSSCFVKSFFHAGLGFEVIVTTNMKSIFASFAKSSGYNSIGSPEQCGIWVWF